MTEPLMTVGLGAIVAYLGKDGVSKLLGPTADYLGGEIKQLAEVRITNLKKIFLNAQKKADVNLEDSKTHAVPPKVLKVIVNDASYSDDLITTEYFGGVLASSRTKIPRDDRGARIAKVIESLSSYHVRAHYIIYSNIINLFKESDYNICLQKDRDEMQIYFPFEVFAKAMDFSDDELNNAQLLDHIFHGLARDGLIDESWVYGDKHRLESYTGFSTDPGIVCKPSPFGVEVFLWAFGYGKKPLSFAFTEKCVTTIDAIEALLPGIVATGIKKST
ncbi:hypothetical protein CTT31_19330 [Pseudoalteromonas maricaloris]|uniref:hypothetical protein n=1 Tax=Pseudoalteromonas maricaloris TaxID=184924 RepID=UPI0021ADE35F|nr:hypothetical protein [Pseudoalteromonas flavipulchra]USE71248.1 hypothetical protein CTT31_19330 [Pseudoalteromonas flavipulchra]